MIRVIGIILILLPISSIGFILSFKLKKQIDFFEEMLLFNKNIEMEICYKSNDIFNISKEFSKMDRYSNLFFLKDLNKIKNDFTFSNIKSFFESYRLNKNDTKILTDYFNKIGKSDVDNQLKHLKMYENIFVNRKNELSKIFNEKSKVYKSVSIFFGLGFLILFI